MTPANVCSREKLESLLGHLNHACSVDRPGRSFIGRLISLLTEAKHKHRNISRINSEPRPEVRWWHMFIGSWNSISILRQQALADSDHKLWSDASGSWGAGAFWNSDWIQFQWPHAIQQEPNVIKELVSIAVACALWGRQVKGHNSESQL